MNIILGGLFFTQFNYLRLLNDLEKVMPLTGFHKLFDSGIIVMSFDIRSNADATILLKSILTFGEILKAYDAELTNLRDCPDEHTSFISDILGSGTGLSPKEHLSSHLTENPMGAVQASLVLAYLALGCLTNGKHSTHADSIFTLCGVLSASKAFTLEAIETLINQITTISDLSAEITTLDLTHIAKQRKLRLKTLDSLLPSKETFAKGVDPTRQAELLRASIEASITHLQALPTKVSSSVVRSLPEARSQDVARYYRYTFHAGDLNASQIERLTTPLPFEGESYSISPEKTKNLFRMLKNGVVVFIVYGGNSGIDRSSFVRALRSHGLCRNVEDQLDAGTTIHSQSATEGSVLISEWARSTQKAYINLFSHEVTRSLHGVYVDIAGDAPELLDD
ncbi:MAG: hypothetical protein EOP06_02870 [Proteobacteria bacterium]|nr:MAG: hypothetical protein EOP06_02870 [Pseudomonadota bacterium]